MIAHRGKPWWRAPGAAAPLPRPWLALHRGGGSIVPTLHRQARQGRPQALHGRRRGCGCGHPAGVVVHHSSSSFLLLLLRNTTQHNTTHNHTAPQPGHPSPSHTPPWPLPSLSFSLSLAPGPWVPRPSSLVPGPWYRYCAERIPDDLFASFLSSGLCHPFSLHPLPWPCSSQIPSPWALSVNSALPHRPTLPTSWAPRTAAATTATECCPRAPPALTHVEVFQQLSSQRWDYHRRLKI